MQLTIDDQNIKLRETSPPQRHLGWLVGWGLTTLSAQKRPYACEGYLLAICHPSDYTVVFGVVIVGISVVVIGVCNRSQMRTSKCTCLIFGVSIDLDAD